MRNAARFVFILCLGGAVLHGQQQPGSPDAVTNPFAGNAAAATAGRAVFNQTCSGCHGEDAQGGRGPALAGIFGRRNEDAEVYRTIRSGIPGSQMPAFSALPTDDVWRIIAYLHSLAAASYVNEAAPGDASAGEALFWGKAGCGQCHEVDERGSDLGPDLSEAAVQPAAHLRAVILNPNGQQVPFYMRRNAPVAITVKTRQGQALTGMRRAEDNFTVLMTDMSGKLRRIERSDIVDEQALPDSLMPADYGKTLTSAEIENLVAYLKTLKHRDLSKTAQAVLPPGLSYERLRNAQKEPGNWLTYWGDYQGDHFSALTQITPQNVKQLQAKWALQLPSGPLLEANPIVVDGVLYTTYTVNGGQGVYAVDAGSGLVIWKYERKQKKINPYQTNPFNRGVAVLGSRVFFGTLDGALIALDARSGREVWSTQVADTMQGYTLTAAPLALKNEVIVGIAGGEFGIRGFLDAYDAQTGKRLWRFNTVPGPGEFGHDTWSGDSWKQGSGATWLTGSYDAELNLLYWTVGNPGPDDNPAVRSGDNLFTCAVLALDPDTGKLKWYYQFTPNDSHDWDANEDVILADAQWNGKPRKLLLQADRNGMYYVLDRTDGKFLFAKAYVKQTWNKGFTADGKPILSDDWKANPEGTLVAPSGTGGADWQDPSYDGGRSRLFVVAADGGPYGFRSATEEYEPGRLFMGGRPFVKGPRPPRESYLLAIDTRNGDVKWKYHLFSESFAVGDMATRTGIVFLATADGNLIALNSDTGSALWHFQTGGRIASAPISYAVDGRQYIALSAGNMLYSFALPE